MKAKERFMLAPHERNSALWQRLIKHCNQRLEDLRLQNDGDRDDQQTAKLRGRIAEVKAIIALADDLPVIE